MKLRKSAMWGDCVCYSISYESRPNNEVMYCYVAHTGLPRFVIAKKLREMRALMRKFYT